MKKILSELMNKRFTTYECGEFANHSSFLDFIRLLAQYSDFFSLMNRDEQLAYMKKSLKDGWGYIDANISVKIS